MNSSKVLLDFAKFKWSDMVHFAMFISLTLFNCSLFSNAPYTQAEFDAAILDLQTKGVIAFDLISNNIKDRDDALVVLDSMMRKLANYVEMESGGNYKKILLSGFRARVYTNHNPKSKLTVKHGKISGSVLAKWGKDFNAFSYVVRYSINEEGLRDVFTEVSAGITKLTINGLQKGKEYMFSLAVVYADKKGVFGNPVFLMVV